MKVSKKCDNNLQLSLLINDIELLLAENSCTLEEVQYVLNYIEKEANIEYVAQQTKNALYSPCLAVLYYGVTDTLRELVEPVITNISQIDLLKFMPRHKILLDAMDRHKKEHPYRNYERDEILNKDVKALDDREEE